MVLSTLRALWRPKKAPKVTPKFGRRKFKRISPPKPKPQAPKPKKQPQPKYQWYKPPNFASHGKMEPEQVVQMDAEYRKRFGNERGGQDLRAQKKSYHAWEEETPRGKVSHK